MPYASQLGGQGVAETGFHVFVLGLLVPAWFCFGKLAQKAGLPQITGYVIGGVLCGYSGMSYAHSHMHGSQGTALLSGEGMFWPPAAAGSLLGHLQASELLQALDLTF